MDNKLKILWLSDIHFFKEYKKLLDDDQFKAYIDSFIFKARTNHKQESPVDYILISGDLAQQGTKLDYTEFWAQMLGPLLDEFLSRADKIPVPKLITIPGNHDVKWTNGEFLDEFINAILPADKDSSNRRAYLTGNRKKFEALFCDYSEFIKEIETRDDSKYLPFMRANNIFFKSPDYTNKALHGYIIDRDKNCIFILLNSSWFSLGSYFNKVYERILKKDEEKLKDIKTILSTKDDLGEYSSQVVGLDFFEFDELNKVLEDYPDYFIATVMHHPLNWLDWNEIYAYPEQKNVNSQRLETILKSSDILLTGHEHVPLVIKTEKIMDDTLHFRAGCFLFDNQKSGKINIKNSWFSILDININLASVTQKRFWFKTPDSAWLDEAPVSLKLGRKHSRYHLNAHRRQIVLDTWNQIDNTKFQSYLKNVKSKNVSVSEIPSPISSFKIFDTNPGDELYLVSIDIEFYKSVTNKTFFAFFEKIMSENDYRHKKVNFVVLDLYVNNHFSDLYTNKSETESRLTILQEANRNADLLFDKLRSDFFKEYEKPEALLDSERSKIFTQFYDLMFVNTIIPYWEVENFFPDSA